MRVLVTTPNGKVGRELVGILKARGVERRLGVHRTAVAEGDRVPLDYGDPTTFAPALAGIEAVYLASPGDAPAEPEMRFVDAARQAGVRRVVKLSAMGVENVDVPLRRVEKHIEASGLEWTFLRPTWFMQNFSTSHAASIGKGTLAEPAAEARTAFIDARDIAAVAAVALTEPGHTGKAYALTGPALLSRSDVAQVLSRELGRPVTYVAISDEQFRAAVTGQMPQRYVDLLSALYAGVRAGWTERQTDDVRQVLGRAPVSFTDFVRAHRAVWA
jgi:uncharacterized protein YbjT (DUF2867 family)